MSEIRTKIPLGIQREVRQRCGFGCVVCGLPLYEYEHMMEWAIVKRHVADEITLLCDRHHREKTNGLLSVDKVRRANSNPYNVTHGISSPYDLHFEGTDAIGVIGGNTFVAQLNPGPNHLHFITIDGTSLINFSFSDGELLLNINLFDNSGTTILVVENNVLKYTVDNWDISFIGKKLTIRQASRDIVVDIVFEPPNKIILNRGKVFFNGIELEISEEYISLIPAYIKFGQITSIGSNTGIRIGKRVQGLSAVFGIDDPARHPH